jgi:hypothetical protein
MIGILSEEIMGSYRVAGIIPLDKERKTEIFLKACKCMKYMTSMSEWLGLISIKGIFHSRFNQVLKVSSKTQLMEISCDTYRYTHGDPVWLRRYY